MAFNKIAGASVTDPTGYSGPTGSATSIRQESETTIYYNGGDAGISTSTPRTTLDVSGILMATSFVTSSELPIGAGGLRDESGNVIYCNYRTMGIGTYNPQRS